MEIGGYKARHPFIKLLNWFEKYAWKHADVVVSNLPAYVQHIKDSGFNLPVKYIPNGVDLAELSNIQDLDTATKKEIPDDKFIIGYVGTIGAANALDFLIKAASGLKEYKDILILIVGDGQEKETLKKQARLMENVQFVNAIDKAQVQSMLALIDVCYIGLKKEKLFEYGVSPNKLFDYMYSSTPILHSISTKKDLVKMANCGISIMAENEIDIADAILNFYHMKQSQREQLGKNGKNYVLKNHTYDMLAKKYADIIEDTKNEQ
jgi:glycosyltransferase involved in cell wall biosynthesis